MTAAIIAWISFTATSFWGLLGMAILPICSVCTIRETCPGGKLQSVVFKKRGQ